MAAALSTITNTISIRPMAITRMEFESDADALAILKPNVYEERNGILVIPSGYQPMQTEWDAIKYLVAEWDFSYIKEEDAPPGFFRRKRTAARR